MRLIQGRIKKREPDYVSTIDANDILTLLDKLDMEHDKTIYQTNRNTLRKIKKMSSRSY